MKAITVNCDSIQVTQGRMEPKYCSNPTAVVESKEIFIGPSGQWKIKGKELCRVEIKDDEITLETEKKLTFSLLQIRGASVADERQWDLFGSRINALYEKYHSKPVQQFSKFLDTTSKHRLGAGNFANRKSSVRAPRRGVFGSQSAVIKKSKLLPQMPWDDEDPTMHDTDRHNLISSGRKLKHHVPEESFTSSDEEDEKQKQLEMVEQDEEETEGPHSEEDNDGKDIQEPKRRRKLISKLKGRQTGVSNTDDDTDDDEIFQSKLDLTTPAAIRMVSPGGTNVTIAAAASAAKDPHDDDDEGKSDSEASAAVANKNQTSISSFFEPRKPRSLDPQQNHVSSTPAKTPPRATSANSARFLKAHSAATTAKKKRVLEDVSTDWLKQSPASKLLSPIDKRSLELFGVSSCKRLALSSEQRKVEDEDPIEEYDDLPTRKGVIKRLMIRENHLNRKRITPIPIGLPTDLAVSSGSPNAQRRFRGLRNLGNTCYLNASLQMLYTCRNLVSALQGSKCGSLTEGVCSVARELSQQDQIPSVSPLRVKDAMDEKTDKFFGYEQRDAHEFLSDLVDYVHEELEKDSKNDEEATAEVSSEPKEKMNFPTDDFCMTVQVCLKCCSCGYSRYAVLCFSHLPQYGCSHVA